VLALGTAAHVTQGADVVFLESTFVVQDHDAPGVHDEGDGRTDGRTDGGVGRGQHVGGVVVVVGVLDELQDKVRVLTVEVLGQAVQAATQALLLNLNTQSNM
jgi:hypothetical protein